MQPRDSFAASIARRQAAAAFVVGQQDSRVTDTERVVSAGM
jgi:hypothetical protein